MYLFLRATYAKTISCTNISIDSIPEYMCKNTPGCMLNKKKKIYHILNLSLSTEQRTTTKHGNEFDSRY